MNNIEMGCPKLVRRNGGEYEDIYSIKINDIYITNISEMNLNLNCYKNSTLDLTIIDPDVDIKLGYYHITSIPSENCGLKLYNIKDIRTGNNIECQNVQFDGKNLSIMFNSYQIEKDEDDQSTK